MLLVLPVTNGMAGYGYLFGGLLSSADIAESQGQRALDVLPLFQFGESMLYFGGFLLLLSSAQAIIGLSLLIKKQGQVIFRALLLTTALISLLAEVFGWLVTATLGNTNIIGMVTAIALMFYALIGVQESAAIDPTLHIAEPTAATPNPTPSVDHRGVVIATEYAGFLRRFAALIIDMLIVMMLVFPLACLIGKLYPDDFVVEAPFGLMTTERTLETNASTQTDIGGQHYQQEQSIIEVTVLDTWRYHYRQTREHQAEQTKTSRQLIDPVTGQALTMTTTTDIEYLVLWLYSILMEASVVQATLGKKALAIKVVDRAGQRLTLFRSLARNSLKVISAFTLMIGFMMAGWTRHKQALHDIMSDCYLICGNDSDR